MDEMDPLSVFAKELEEDKIKKAAEESTKHAAEESRRRSGSFFNPFDDDEEDERESILLPTVDRLSDPDFSNVPDLTYWLPAITTALHSGDHRCVTPFPFSLLKLL